MANVHETLDALFTAVADAIRAKDGTSAPIVADDFPDRIAAIPSGQEIHFAPSDSTEYQAIKIVASNAAGRIRLDFSGIPDLNYPLAFSGVTDEQIFSAMSRSWVFFLNSGSFESQDLDTCMLLAEYEDGRYLESNPDGFNAGNKTIDFILGGSIADSIVSVTTALRDGGALIYV